MQEVASFDDITKAPSPKVYGTLDFSFADEDRDKNRIILRALYLMVLPSCVSLVSLPRFKGN